MLTKYNLQNKPPFGALINKTHPFSFGMEEAFLLNTCIGSSLETYGLQYSSPFNTHILFNQKYVSYPNNIFSVNSVGKPDGNVHRDTFTMPILDGYSECTVLMRVKTFDRTISPFQFFFSIGDAGLVQIMTYFNYANNNVKTFFTTSSGRVQIGDANIITIQNDEWVDVVIRYSGSAVELIVNGQLAESVAHTGTMHPSYGSIFVGSRYFTSSDGLYGEMEYAYVYHKYLDDHTIQSLQQNPYQIVEPFYLPPPKGHPLPPPPYSPVVIYRRRRVVGLW